MLSVVELGTTRSVSPGLFEPIKLFVGVLGLVFDQPVAQ